MYKAHPEREVAKTCQQIQATKSQIFFHIRQHTSYSIKKAKQTKSNVNTKVRRTDNISIENLCQREKTSTSGPKKKNNSEKNSLFQLHGKDACILKEQLDNEHSKSNQERKERTPKNKRKKILILRVRRVKR